MIDIGYRVGVFSRRWPPVLFPGGLAEVPIQELSDRYDTPVRQMRQPGAKRTASPDPNAPRRHLDWIPIVTDTRTCGAEVPFELHQTLIIPFRAAEVQFPQPCLLAPLHGQ